MDEKRDHEEKPFCALCANRATHWTAAYGWICDECAGAYNRWRDRLNNPLDDDD